MFFCWGGLWFLRSRLQDDSVTVLENFHGEKVMLIFPHPDDEITCAGTLKKLDLLGNETILITLTRGEAGSTNGLIDESDLQQKKIKLGQLRQQELQSVSQLLGIDRLEILDFPDGGIQDIAADLIEKVIREKIDRYQPTILITYDDRIGFYGHQDHLLIARYTKEIFLKEKDSSGFPVKKLYQVTLPKPAIEVALKISESFRQSYTALTKNGLPEPTFAVNIAKFGNYKRDAMLLHRSQKPTFDEMQPYFDRIPPFIYFRIFDKEYFAEVGNSD
ncbi:MAG: PIG-L deacetylase family protein [Xenococcaceae cyanobacterium]